MDSAMMETLNVIDQSIRTTVKANAGKFFTTTYVLLQMIFAMLMSLQHIGGQEDDQGW